MTDFADGTFVRSGGFTEAEGYLKQLCDRSFLSLWSYVNVFRDQGRKNEKADGKEVCDLLVVFENDILIFSDKACKFKSSGDLLLDWRRWLRKAVFQSADQVWGAERWIKEHPDRLFMDRACTKPFPIELPNMGGARFHRIVVAHDVSDRCRQEQGGSGSLRIDSTLVAEAHNDHPLTIGQLNAARGFVHVLDDVTLDILLATLDTVSDFVRYLVSKERLVTHSSLVCAAGEEDLLAVYLRQTNERGEHDFNIPSGDGLIVAEGAWLDFAKHEQRVEQINANKGSYAWDVLVEDLTHHLVAGTSHHATTSNISENENALRFMARESRTRRRILIDALFELITKTSGPKARVVRIIPPTESGQPFYLFLLLSAPSDPSEEHYRAVRQNFLEAHCSILKLIYPEASDVIGIATETKESTSHSQDFLYMNVRDWTEKDAENAQRVQDETGFLKNLSVHYRRVLEYPEVESKSESGVQHSL